MDIAEMHVAFRQYAQQMGMQNVRAILPEQIDLLINQSITDTINQLIRENIGVTNDRVITDNSKIGQINAFRTLYNVKEVDIKFNGTGITFTFDQTDKITGLIKHTSDGGTDLVFGDYMFLVDISINYTSATDVGGVTNTIVTPWYPVRIIDSAYLSDTLNDFILKNRFRSPVACVYKQNSLELYIDNFNLIDNTGVNPVPKITFTSGGQTTTLTPNKLRIDLVENPAKVRYLADIAGGSVDCNLPESMHGDIVKHAVDLYRVAVNGSLYSNQQAEQNQQQENVRNNYRNEGQNNNITR